MPRTTTPHEATQRHARAILHHVLGDDARQPGTTAYERLRAGINYAAVSNPAAIDATLAQDGTDIVARRVLREGADLTSAGLELGPHKTKPQASAWAGAKLDSALKLLLTHPARIERDNTLAKLTKLVAHKARVEYAKRAIPSH